MNKKYKTIYFDFFGTLVIYASGNYFKIKRKRTFNFLIKNGLEADYAQWRKEYTHSFQSFEKEAKKTLNEVHSYDMMRDALSKLFKKTPDDRLVKQATNIYVKEWCEDVYAIEDIYSLLAYLSSKYELVIVSNTHFPELVAFNLKRFKMESYFSNIITSVSFGKRKPHPAIYQEALRKSQTVISEALFIGDSYEEDYLGAKGIKMDALLIDPLDKYMLLKKEKVKNILDIKYLL